MYKEVLYTVSASMLWGVFPLYLKTLYPVPALEILAHRIIWAFVFAIIVLLCRREGFWPGWALCNLKTIALLGASALLLSINWLLYIWAVTAGYIVEASLGYFIAPLLNVLFGAVFLREQLHARHKIAVATAVLGIVYVTLHIGSVPWLGLTVATVFAGYTLLKKITPLGGVAGLALEMAVLIFPALFYLGYLEESGRASLTHTGIVTALKVGGIGIYTAVLLLVFTAGARKLPLATLGFLQYLTPSFQFLIGVFLFHEPLSAHHLVGFSLIWGALVIYWSGAATAVSDRAACVAPFIKRRVSLVFQTSTRPN
ncbi:MAG: EamA family transporter RarD [Chloroflexi bacterium]|nr:MAG: EamA family transporter RarD [Chloroflexota bacterium]